MTIISDAYILGIKEGRSFLSNNPGMTKDDMQSAMANCSSNMASHSQPMKDIFKGQRDFWRNQIKNA